MSPELVHLHLSQITNAFERSKTNNYSDCRKQEYHAKLRLLFEQVKTENIDSFAQHELIQVKAILDFCFLSLEFLDNSVLTITPHEIVYCLETVLNYWDSSNKFIIVTTLNNDIHGYYFSPALSKSEAIYKLIKSRYNIIFERRLIQISLPKYLVHDYLANVVLYHELGHFIDIHFNITQTISKTLKLNATQSRHYAEFFADIFAAQYIANATSNYLNYIAFNNDNSPTHPATRNRIAMVSDFLSNKHTNHQLQTILNACQQILNKPIDKRFESFGKQDFTDLIPVIIENDAQLHGLFKIGWELWLEQNIDLIDKGIDNEEKYRIINNLIEKSISNYMILKNW